MIGPKTSYEIDSAGHPIVFFSRYNPFNLKFSLQSSYIGYLSLEYVPLIRYTLSANKCFEYFHFHCFCIGIPLYIYVSETSKMVLKAVRWSLPILIFWQNLFSMICQVWLHCLQLRLSSDNEIEMNIHEELDLQIKRMLLNLLYNSILCPSYSDIILVYTPACVFFSSQFILWFEKLKMAYTVSNLSKGFLHSVPHVLNIFYHNFPRVVLHFHCPKSYLGFG